MQTATTGLFFFWGDKYMFSGDHQEKIHQAPEGSRFPVSHCRAPMLSGQPRFGKSHALITLPSVKIAPKEGVVSELGWHKFSRWGRGWGRARASSEARPRTRCYEAFLYRAICIAEKLSQARHLHYYDEFMQKSAAISRNVRARVEGREGGRETVIKSSHFGTFVSSQ